MPHLILFDDPALRSHLLPFTFTRPVAQLRVGILTIAEKWKLRLGGILLGGTPLGETPSFQTEAYLQTKFPLRSTGDNLFINGAVCPTDALTDAVKTLRPGEGLQDETGTLLAARSEKLHTETLQITTFREPLTIIRRLPDIFLQNGAQIREDFRLLTAGRKSQPITDPFTRCYAPENIFVEEGVTVRASILNAEGGPIYLGKGSTIAEGSVVIGPFALGEGSTVNWGGKMRANTTIGPGCKVGGEVGNSVFLGYSNKAHDGFLGNSVIGEWCNLGAATNNSNLKNDYTNVKLHSYATGQLEDTGLLFCGLMMGDFTKAGIGTLFNTGTVVGVNANVFGAGLQAKHIPSFTWGGAAEGYTPYRLDKALYVANETLARRDKTLDDVEEGILREVFLSSNKQ